jgi:hypothetical protein
VPNNRIRDKRQPSLSARLNQQSKARTAGYGKTNADEVRLFKQRVKDGMDPEDARKGTKISARMVGDIMRGRTWASVILLLAIAAVTMGADGCNSNEYRVICQGINYPLCRNVAHDYPCLCLSDPQGLTVEEAEQLRYEPYEVEAEVE